jgi:hypothetical protein
MAEVIPGRELGRMPGNMPKDGWLGTDMRPPGDRTPHQQNESFRFFLQKEALAVLF